jgi:pyrroloquinoline quinone (PQQ) biosynthesis protein C
MNTDYVRTLALESEAFVETLQHQPVLGKIISGEASREDYVGYLIATFHYVRWSGFLLAKTAQGLRSTGRCPALLSVLDAKVEEEGPHDTWLLRDLQSLGLNPYLVRGSAVPTAVRAYVEWSSTLANAGSPAFLGAAYTLEFISMRRAKTASDNLRARRAIPNIERALRFLDGHGVADHGHIAELEAVLGQVRDESAKADIAFSSEVMRRLYPCFFAAES